MQSYKGYHEATQEYWVLADGIYYNMSVAVDEDVEDGDLVWVMIDTTGTRAVVVGK